MKVIGEHDIPKGGLGGLVLADHNHVVKPRPPESSLTSHHIQAGAETGKEG